MDCLAVPTHYSGEYNLGTCTLHHHSTAKALFVGSCITFLPHHLTHRFVRFDSGGNHFCLCRPDTVCAAEVLVVVDYSLFQKTSS